MIVQKIGNFKKWIKSFKNTIIQKSLDDLKSVLTDCRSSCMYHVYLLPEMADAIGVMNELRWKGE